MPEQFERIERHLDKIEKAIETIRADINDLKTSMGIERELMRQSRSDIDRLYARAESNKTEITVLKTKAGFLGTIGGVIAGAIAGVMVDLIRRP